MENGATPSHRAPKIHDFLTRWATITWPVPSPEEKYQQDLKNAKSALDAAENQPKPSGDEDAFDKRLADISQCIARWQDLKASYETTVKPAEREFQKALLDQQKMMTFEFLDLFDPETMEEFITEWREKRSTIVTKTQPDPSHAQARLADIRALATPESTVSKDAGDSSQALIAPPKRLTNFPKTNLGPPSKRARANPSQSQYDKPLTDSFIYFLEVYQNGSAAQKHRIVEWQGYWYILQCKQHKRTFPNDPIKAACKHLNAKSHGNLKLNYEQAIARLGTEVKNCDKHLAKLNNDVAERALYDSIGRPLSSFYRHDARRRGRILRGLDPKPGEVYTMYWGEPCNRYYAFFVLPWGNCHSFGWDMSLKDTSLLEHIPESCQLESITGTVEWTAPYRPGGTKHKHRPYPVMFFDDTNFPWNCASCWVAVSLFELYDPEQDVPHKDLVSKFIKERESLGSEQLQERPPGSSLQRRIESIVIPDTDSQDEDGPIYTFPDVADTPQGQRVKLEADKEAQMQYTKSTFARTSPTLQGDNMAASGASSGAPHQTHAEMRDSFWSGFGDSFPYENTPM
ncbi:hypothetical protein IL306_000441 [Fusarium sp. DS 682]|nr:hypothetical protein IL306_000441 [Fusarium sp. DS 682]